MVIHYCITAWVDLEIYTFKIMKQFYSLPYPGQVMVSPRASRMAAKCD